MPIADSESLDVKKNRKNPFSDLTDGQEQPRFWSHDDVMATRIGLPSVFWSMRAPNQCALGLPSVLIVYHDKGKPSVRMGRKAMGPVP